ncbi:MAG: hypothetical protein V4489_02570 [Chlamydiota bacterium]
MFSMIGLTFFLLHAYSEEKPFIEKQTDEMDSRIEVLEVQKKQYQKNIERHLNLAHRWQSNEDLSLESRREYSLAEHQKDRLHILEKKLEKLKKEKENQEK